MFRRIEKKESNQKPFFDAWEKGLSSERKEELSGCDEKAISIKETSGEKGYIVTFTEFIVFVWGNSAEGNTIKSFFEALEDGEYRDDNFGIYLYTKRGKLCHNLGFCEGTWTNYLLIKPEMNEIEFLTDNELKERTKNRAKAVEGKKVLKAMRDSTLAKLDELAESRKTP